MKYLLIQKRSIRGQRSDPEDPDVRDRHRGRNESSFHFHPVGFFVCFSAAGLLECAVVAVCVRAHYSVHVCDR